MSSRALLSSTEEYKTKTQRVCGREGCAKEGKVINRIVRWTPQGYESEGDLRHAEVVVEQLGVRDLPSLSAPGVGCVDPELGHEDDVELDTNLSKVVKKAEYFAKENEVILLYSQNYYMETEFSTIESEVLDDHYNLHYPVNIGSLG